MTSMTAINNPKQIMAGPAMEEKGPRLSENINIVLVTDRPINSKANIVAVTMPRLGADTSPDGTAVRLAIVNRMVNVVQVIRFRTPKVFRIDMY